MFGDFAGVFWAWLEIIHVESRVGTENERCNFDMNFGFGLVKAKNLARYIRTATIFFVRIDAGDVMADSVRHLEIKASELGLMIKKSYLECWLTEND